MLCACTCYARVHATRVAKTYACSENARERCDLRERVAFPNEPTGLDTNRRRPVRGIGPRFDPGFLRWHNGDGPTDPECRRRRLPHLLQRLERGLGRDEARVLRPGVGRERPNRQRNRFFLGSCITRLDSKSSFAWYSSLIVSVTGITLKLGKMAKKWSRPA